MIDPAKREAARIRRNLRNRDKAAAKRASRAPKRYSRPPFPYEIMSRLQRKGLTLREISVGADIPYDAVKFELYDNTILER